MRTSYETFCIVSCQRSVAAQSYVMRFHPQHSSVPQPSSPAQDGLSILFFDCRSTHEVSSRRQNVTLNIPNNYYVILRKTTLKRKKWEMAIVALCLLPVVASGLEFSLLFTLRTDIVSSKNYWSCLHHQPLSQSLRGCALPLLSHHLSATTFQSLICFGWWGEEYQNELPAAPSHLQSLQQILWHTFPNMCGEVDI